MRHFVVNLAIAHENYQDVRSLCVSKSVFGGVCVFSSCVIDVVSESADGLDLESNVAVQ